jgi:very-short-patch-repair endonuclease
MEALAVVAREQRGIVTRPQCRDAGIPDRTVDLWLATGRLERIHRSVYRMAGAPPCWEQSLRAAVLAAGPGALASHRAAARLWGLVDEAPVEISVDRPLSHRLDGVLVHRTRDAMAPSLRHGIPVTTPMRAIVDLGAVCPASQVEDAMERGLVARLFTVAGVEWARADVARRGRQGAGVLREVLDRRALGDARPDGILEPRMAKLLRDFGLPSAVFQHPIGRWVVDFAYPERMVALEVDGWEVHSSPAALQRDLERQNALVALGWTVLRFTWRDVVLRPGAVARQIQAVLGAKTAA